MKVEGSKYSFIRANHTTVYEDGKETETKSPRGDTIKVSQWLLPDYIEWPNET